MLLAIPINVSTLWFLPISTGLLALGWLIVTSLNLFRSPPKVGHTVLGWLAGICLIDAFFLALLGQPLLILIAIGCFILTLLGHRFIMGT